MARVGMHEAKSTLSRLVQRAEAGEEIVIQRRGKSVARLVAIEDEGPSLGQVRGAWRGRVELSPDFDELPDDLADAFGR